MRKTTEMRAPRRTNQKNEQSGASGALLFSDALKSFPLSIGIGFLTLLCFSLVAYFQKDPTRWILPLGLAAAAITAFFGGWILVRRHRCAALLCGLLSGTLLGCLLLILSLFFVKYATGYAVWLSCLIHIAFLLCSVAGAYAGFPRPSKHPAKRKKPKHS